MIFNFSYHTFSSNISILSFLSTNNATDMYWNLSSLHPNSLSAPSRTESFSTKQPKGRVPSFLSECILRNSCYLWTLREEKKKGIGDILFKNRYTTYTVSVQPRILSLTVILGRMSKGKKVKEGEVEGENEEGADGSVFFAAKWQRARANRVRKNICRYVPRSTREPPTRRQQAIF